MLPRFIKVTQFGAGLALCYTIGPLVTIPIIVYLVPLSDTRIKKDRLAGHVHMDYVSYDEEDAI